MKSAGCSCATITDNWNGYECEVTGGACVFIRPNSKACAEIYGEGPDAHPDEKESVKNKSRGTDERRKCDKR